MGEIKRLYKDEEHIVIFSFNTQQILLFARNGDFLRKIGTKGNANNEYVYLYDAVYDENKKLIYAYDSMRNKMLTYDMNGNVVNVVQSEFNIASFAKCDGGFWAYTYTKDNNPGCYNLMLLDETLSIMKKGYFPSGGNFFEVTLYPTFYNDACGNTLFFHPYSTSVYMLGDSVKEIFRPDFGERNTPFDRIIYCVNAYELTKSGLEFYNEKCGRTITNDSNNIVVLFRAKKK